MTNRLYRRRRTLLVLLLVAALLPILTTAAPGLRRPTPTPIEPVAVRPAGTNPISGVPTPGDGTRRSAPTWPAPGSATVALTGLATPIRAGNLPLAVAGGRPGDQV